VRDRLTGGLGETFRGDEISIKPYACCKYGPQRDHRGDF
jgi:hypothetical protein